MILMKEYVSLTTAAMKTGKRHFYSDIFIFLHFVKDIFTFLFHSNDGYLEEKMLHWVIPT